MSCLLHHKEMTGQRLWARHREKKSKGGGGGGTIEKERGEICLHLGDRRKEEDFGSALKALQKPRSPPRQICEMRKWPKGQGAGGR